ncbi:ubiquitin carboxyl-terminal hydrolase 25 isoform X2 [Engraulis encrasicolus]|uniref:ubiquitin carboxyl-terminal hydrolase 25 isoform X2 n=1 Tax=Engraulis encrasicolus TaxID=184585 RepID=UPI002FD05485
MTVEQNVLQQHSQKTLLNQLKEVTGTTDSQLLQQALQVSNGDLAEAVAFLTEKNTKVPQVNETTYYQTAQVAGNDRYISVGSQADSNVIDLTGDDKDDLQRAIALSLEESNRAFRETGITDEEQAISRILEASIAENKATLKRSHAEVWRDSPNPYDRKRQDSCPVGLKNVGNTCWFSAVIQSLFNLLEFQRLVLHYSPPARAQDQPRNQKERRNLPFMQELRNLFSLMVGSNRKYVDPSRAVEILQEAFQSSESQQDVCEFTHKLLDWLEDAFQVKAEETREAKEPKNPMVELFYGRFVAVGVLEGKKFENTEMFGQYPLQVNGFKDLHECLEAAMVEGEIESLHSAENTARSGQEHWFTELPPVLTFELSRFEFNQALGRPEKIHNKLEFPPMLYMDRYMDKNRDITRLKREEIRRLKDHLTVLQQRLERYLSYGSGPKRFPLADVLQYALEFASSKPVCTSPVDDIDAATPSAGATAKQQPPSHTSPAEQQGAASGPAEGAVPTTQQKTPPYKPFTQSCLPPNLPMHPAPRNITDDELRTLEGCLHRWRSEVETDTRDLQSSISRIHRTIELMYSDKSMMQVPYRLHAVLVHEGQAIAGHYWAYIFDPRHNGWMKYNDISVTKSSWEELMRDSFGGYRNASAYCLMYINDKKRFLIEEEFDVETGLLLSGLSKLPAELQEYVKEDNLQFERELKVWDMLQARKAQQEKQALATATAAAAAATAAAAAAAAAAATTATATTAAAPPAGTGTGAGDGAVATVTETQAQPDSTAHQPEPEYMEQQSPTEDCHQLREETQRAIARAATEHGAKGPEVLLNASNSIPPFPTHPHHAEMPNPTHTAHHHPLPTPPPYPEREDAAYPDLQPEPDPLVVVNLHHPQQHSHQPPTPYPEHGGPDPELPVVDQLVEVTIPRAETFIHDSQPELPMVERHPQHPRQPPALYPEHGGAGVEPEPPVVDQLVEVTIPRAETFIHESQPELSMVEYHPQHPRQPPAPYPSHEGTEPVPEPQPLPLPEPPVVDQIVEVTTPRAETFIHESQEEEGWDDEALLTPSMQGVLMAVGKTRKIFDKLGPETAFFKAIEVEYTRLLHLAQEDTPPERDHRLQHPIVYFIQNEAPQKILERTLLAQFADRNLAFDERCKSIMQVACAKMELITPEEVNMQEYELWHREYQKYRETTVYLMIGLELYKKESYVESLVYLIYAYQFNKELLSKGQYRGHDERLIAHYRRECLLKLNEHAARLFESGEEPEVVSGLSIMLELVVPCIPLLLLDDSEEKDLIAVEDIRNRWCSYLGQEMEPHLQEKLTDFLPKLLDCSTEIKGFLAAPKLGAYSTLELCQRFTRIMAALGRIPADGR